MGIGPFQSFQWFDKVTTSGVIVMLLWRSVPLHPAHGSTTLA
jgi:hypothetical protein